MWRVWDPTLINGRPGFHYEGVGMFESMGWFGFDHKHGTLAYYDNAIPETRAMKVFNEYKFPTKVRRHRAKTP